jgi:uncharacterized membrane protein
VDHVLVAFVMVFVYDAIMKSPLAKTTPPAPPRNAYIVCFLVMAAMLFAFRFVGNMSSARIQIHMGVMLGTRDGVQRLGTASGRRSRRSSPRSRPARRADAALVGMAGARSRHNTYMSVPLLWFMLNQHTSASGMAGGKLQALGAVEQGDRDAGHPSRSRGTSCWLLYKKARQGAGVLRPA